MEGGGKSAVLNLEPQIVKILNIKTELQARTFSDFCCFVVVVAKLTYYTHSFQLTCTMIYVQQSIQETSTKTEECNRTVLNNIYITLIASV